MRLINGDCLEVMNDIPDKSVDMILADLPYGITSIVWDVIIPFEKLWAQYERVIKDKGAIVLFSAQPFTTDLINSNRKLFRYEIIWEKTHPKGHLLANKMPMKAHENIEVFYKHPTKYNPQKTQVYNQEIGKKNRGGGIKIDNSLHYGGHKIFYDPAKVETGLRFPVTVIKFSNHNGHYFGKEKNATKHPTQKPIALLEYLIKTYTDEGATVLDNVMGSGSTGVACVNTNRNFIGIELDKEYFEFAKKRIEDAEIIMASRLI